MEFLDLGKLNAPYMAEIEEAVIRVIRSGRYIGGGEVIALENNLCQLTGAPYAVGISNGLDALRLMLRANIILGRLHEGDEVIVAANTYIATILAIQDAGLKPVLAEPSPQTLNLDSARLEEYLTSRTRAVMVVHLYGRACCDTALVDFCTRHGLLLLEDNAQAIGAKSDVAGLFGSNVTGALGHAGAFSFYPTKNLGAMGDAGAVVTFDEDVAKTVRALANYGSDRRYHNIYQGFNCRLDPIQAAILNVKFKYLADENRHRRQLAAIYNEAITNQLIELPYFGGVDDESNVWHQYPIMVEDRDRFLEFLKEHNIGHDIHYATPPHMQPCMAHISHGPLPITERVAAREVSLPITTCTSEHDAQQIATFLNSVTSF